jgi:hypothetical protein
MSVSTAKIRSRNVILAIAAVLCIGEWRSVTRAVAAPQQVASVISAHRHADGGSHDHSGEDPHRAADRIRLSHDEESLLAAANDVVKQSIASGPAHLTGRWSQVYTTPVVAVHAAALPDGRVLMFDSLGDDSTGAYPDERNTYTRAAIFDPATGQSTRHDVDTGRNLFCAGHAYLPNGELYLAGGNLDAAQNGITATTTFNPVFNAWRAETPMREGRWYPSVTPLGNGEMMIQSGYVYYPEVRQLDGALRQLNGAWVYPTMLYPWLIQAPDGGVSQIGPEETMRKYETAYVGAQSAVGTRDAISREYGSFALYDVGMALVAGGGLPPTRTALIVDFNNSAAPVVTATASMTTARRQHYLTVLADGSVLATGGIAAGDLVNMSSAVLTTELWSPATRQWRTLEPMAVSRQYHATTLLLPDGRVFTGGGGVCNACTAQGYLAKNAQTFAPPYLFARDGSGALAARPVISSAPLSLAFGESFSVTSSQAATITKAGLVRLSSSTHSVNYDQRYVPLSLTRSGGVLTMRAPASGNIAPPGLYMLFVLNADGTPSVAWITMLGGFGAASNTCAALPRANQSVRTATNPGTAARLIDGSSTSAWTSAEAPSNTNFIELDLGATQTIGGVLLDASAAPAAQLGSARVLVSTDGVRYALVQHQRIAGAVSHLAFRSTRARYVRVLPGVDHGNTAWSLGELNACRSNSALGVPEPLPGGTDGLDGVDSEPTSADSARIYLPLTTHAKP